MGSADSMFVLPVFAGWCYAAGCVAVPVLKRSAIVIGCSSGDGVEGADPYVLGRGCSCVWTRLLGVIRSAACVVELFTSMRCHIRSVPYCAPVGIVWCGAAPRAARVVAATGGGSLGKGAATTA